MTIMNALIGSALYASSHFFKKHVGDEPQELDIKKLASTVVLGVGIGAVMYLNGVTVITEEDIGTQVAMYGFLTAVIENAGKFIYRVGSKILEKYNITPW